MISATGLYVQVNGPGGGCTLIHDLLLKHWNTQVSNHNKAGCISWFNLFAEVPND